MRIPAKLLRAFGPFCVGAILFAVGPLLLAEPLGIALWAVIAAMVLLTLAWSPVAQAFVPVATTGEMASLREHRQECLCYWKYAAACGPVFLGTLIFAGIPPAIVVAAVALSLVGGAAMLVAVRVRADVAIGLTIAGAAAAFTWPIWAADLLTHHDLGPWLQRIINVSPAFALNAAISPSDPLTHRPLAYRLMNLGQDVTYAMPASIWPCVLLHAAVGGIGLVGRRVMGRGWTRMNADGADAEEAAVTSNVIQREP